MAEKSPQIICKLHVLKLNILTDLISSKYFKTKLLDFYTSAVIVGFFYFICKKTGMAISSFSREICIKLLFSQ